MEKEAIVNAGNTSKFILLFSTLCFVVQSHIGAQSKSDYLDANEEGLDFVSIQRQFDEWSRQNDLTEAKGWKWYKRWEDHYLKRTDGSGRLVDPTLFFKEALKFQASGKLSAKGNSYSWIPVGLESAPFKADSLPTGLGRINCVAFHPANQNVFWVGVAQGGIWKTSDGGQNWTPINNGLPILRISDIAVDPSNTDVLYTCLGDYEYNGVSLKLDDRKRHTHYGLGVYKTVNGGDSWFATGLTVLQTSLDYSLLRKLVINPSNTDELVAGGLEGIWRSTDAGSNWTKVYNNVISDIEQVVQDPKVLYAATSFIKTMNAGSATVLKSMDFGMTWMVLNSTIPPTGQAQRVDIAISPIDSSYIYAVACDMIRGLQGIYASANGGMSWTKRNVSVNILNWDNQPGGQGNYDLALTVDPLNKNKIYAGGINLWTSIDGGTNWEMLTYWSGIKSLHADQHQLKFNPLNNRLYACHDGGICYTDSPVTGSFSKVQNDPTYRLPTRWTDITAGMQITSFYRLSLRKDFEGHVIAGAQDNNSRYFNGYSWTAEGYGDGMECVLMPSDTGIFWLSWQYGTILRVDRNSGYITYAMPGPYLSGEWTTPFLFDEDNSLLIAGYGDVHYSFDLGDSWLQASNFSNIPGLGRPSYASALAQSSGHRETLYLAKRINHPFNYPAQLWRTQNLGANWTNVTGGLPDSLYFTYICVDDDDSGLAWVTVSGFVDGVKIFKTENGGSTWSNISYDLPNVSTNCVVLDEQSDQHQLYLANDLGVFTTNDLLTSWIPFSTDLPNVIVSELEINYKSNSLYAATFGRGLWKTALLDSSFDDTLGVITQINRRIELNVFPNPNTGSFTAVFDSRSASDIRFEIIDISGNTVFREKKRAITGSNSFAFETRLSSGQYFLMVLGPEIRVVEKFIVDR